MSGLPAATLGKLATFAVVCALGAAWLVVQLGGFDLFADRLGYEVELRDVNGLHERDAVKIAGVLVGRVTDTRIDRGRAVVRFTVDEDVRLGDETTVTVRWRNLLGLRYLELTPAGDGTLPAGHRFPPEAATPPADLSALLERLTPVMHALDPEVSNVVVRALAESLTGREEEVRAIIADAGAFLDAVASRDDETRRIIDDTSVLLDAFADRAGDVRRLIDRFADVSVAVADRNDALVGAIERLGDLQAELAATVTATDQDITGALAALDAIAAVLSVNHDEIEDILAYTSTGIVQYHRISRWGQWFNIRAPGLSFAEETITTERGAALPPRSAGGSSGGGGDGAPSSGTSFGALLRAGAR